MGRPSSREAWSVAARRFGAGVLAAMLGGALWACGSANSSAGSAHADSGARADGGAGTDSERAERPDGAGITQDATGANQNEGGQDSSFGADARPDGGGDASPDGSATCIPLDQFPAPPPARANAAATCLAPTPCGGALSGTWTLGSLCLTQSSLFDAVNGVCSTATVSSVAVDSATGAISVAGGSLTYDLHAKVSATVQFPNNCSFCRCSALEGQLGSAGLVASCNPVCNSGTCTCTVEKFVDVSDTGQYTTSGTALTTGGGHSFDYCAGSGSISMTDRNTKLGVATFVPPTATPEKCDGIDNDLDGIIDDHLRDCPAACLTQGVCTAHSETCGGATGWNCSYPASYEQTETRCDGLDNDCNGVVDDEPAADRTCAASTGTGYVCSNGACSCPHQVCAGACVDTQIDASNCGGCGIVCPTLATCASGSCQCPSSKPTACGGSCVDTTSDANNCGTCNTKCAVVCSASACIGVTHLALGSYTTFAVLSDGTARGCGADSQGDLGNAATNTGATYAPVALSGLAGVGGVASGGRCAWLTSGAPYCWGANDFGQVGDGSNRVRTSPTPVLGLTKVAGMAAGSDFTCAWLPGGTAFCWGDGTSYQLGTGNAGTVNVPEQVSGLTTVVEIAAGLQHACARTSAGTVYCWGANGQGPCGTGNFGTYVMTPSQVAGITTANQIVTGDLHTCALLSNGTVDCWGDNNYGQIGDASTNNRASPVAVPALTSVVQIAAGSSHTCARLADGSVRCWGWNQDGELGDGTMTSRSSPVVVSGISGAQDLAAGGEHTCVRLATGAVQCWGNDVFGQLGANVGSTSSSPVSMSW